MWEKTLYRLLLFVFKLERQKYTRICWRSAKLSLRGCRRNEQPSFLRKGGMGGGGAGRGQLHYTYPSFAIWVSSHTKNKQTSNIFRCENSPVGSQAPELLLGVLSGSQAPPPTPNCSHIPLTGCSSPQLVVSSPNIPFQQQCRSDTQNMAPSQPRPT